jgi:hypothetical protein
MNATSIKREARVGRAPIRTSSEFIRPILDGGAVEAVSFRNGTIERFWACGCCVTYLFSKSEEIDWISCGGHTPDNAPAKQSETRSSKACDQDGRIIV